MSLLTRRSLKDAAFDAPVAALPLLELELGQPLMLGAVGDQHLLYDAVADLITARGLQFTVEVIGYGDHLGSRTRLQIVFELRGPVPQIVYYRDLTALGVTYPLRRAEEEQWSKSSDDLG